VRAVTTAQEKLIHWITLARYERYDMRRDPGETVPLTAGAEVDRLTARLSTWEQRHTARQDVTREAGPASASERTRPTAAQDEIERQLRSLGYLE
jgi:hypothetical protein